VKNIVKVVFHSYDTIMRCILFTFLALLLSSPVLSQSAGERDYDPVSKTYKYYNGSVWKQFSVNIGVVGCSTEGTLNYNTALNYYEYCDGVRWLAIIGLPTLTPCTKRSEMNYSGGNFYYCDGILWNNISVL